MAKIIKFEGKTISVPDDATDDEITSIIDGGGTPSPVIQDSPEVVKQKLASVKQGLADVQNMTIDKPNESISETLGFKVPEVIKNAFPASRILDLPIKSTVQGASSGPVMGAVQMVADALGNEKLSNEIAKNAREGNFIGSLMQPEALLTGKAAGNLIGQGAKWYGKAGRAGLTAAPYAATSVVANPSDDKLTDRAIQGAVGGSTAMVASPILSAATRASQYLIDAVRGRSGKVAAGKMARDVAGDKINEIVQLNKNAPSDITSAQATLDADRDVWQSFGKIAENKDKSSYYRMLGDLQEAGRLNALENVKPDLNTVTTQRANITDPLYKAVRGGTQQVQTSPISDKIDDLLNKNSGNKTLVNALNEVKDGLYDDSGKLVTNPEKISSIMDGLKTSMASKDNKFILGTLTDIRADIAKAIPGRVNADAQYSKLSKPVNQAKVIDAMVGTLKASKGGERTTPFLNAMGTGENALIKRADQSPRYGGLDDILNTPQKSARDKVVNELRRDAEVERRAIAGRGGSVDIVDGDSWKARLPPLVDAKFGAANKVLDIIETKVNKGTMDAIVEGMKSGKNANEMLNTLPSGERLKVIQALKNQKAIPYFSGAIVGKLQQGEQ